MKFLLITLEYFPFKGGVANYYTNLVYYWPKHSSLSIISNNNKELLSKFGIFKWRKSLFKLYHYIKKNKINYLIVGHLLPLGISAFILNKILGTKYCIILHGMDLSFATRNRWKRFVSKRILNNADKVICANSYTAKLCASFARKDLKIEIVNPGVKDFSFFDDKKIEKVKKDNNLNGRPVLFSLGRLVKRKGFDTTIKALKIILNKYPDLNLLYLIAGIGPDEKYLKNLAEDYPNHIKFINQIDESEKWSLFSLCDIFIMPSRNIKGDFEGFGIVYLEANLAKKAVIAGDSGGVSDAVVDNFNGILVDPENPEEIASAILKLLQDDKLRISLGEQGRTRALQEFNWKQQAEKMFNFLHL